MTREGVERGSGRWCLRGRKMRNGKERMRECKRMRKV